MIWDPCQNTVSSKDTPNICSEHHTEAERQHEMTKEDGDKLSSRLGEKEMR